MSGDISGRHIMTGILDMLSGLGSPRLSPLVQFHVGRGKDSAGRRHEEVLSLDDDHLEWTYDWTQWTFPVFEESELCPKAPPLTDEDLETLRKSDIARERMGAARDRMISFLQDGSRWLRESDYNHFRITRAIKSIRLILGDQPADDFRRTVFEMMMQRPHRVGKIAIQFWRNA